MISDAIKNQTKAINALADLAEVDEDFGMLAIAAAQGDVAAYIEHGALYVVFNETTYRVDAYAQH